jgi:hypothetical protein
MTAASRMKERRQSNKESPSLPIPFLVPRSGFLVRLFVLFITAMCGCSEPKAPLKAGYEWPTPSGWKSERIPFPLDFAPALPYRGVEELRFAPRFFKPSSDTYFTYTFAFVLEDAPAFGTEQLAGDLKTYFTGLAGAVKKAPSDPNLHSARVTPTTEGQFTGIVKTIDAFGDSRPLELNLIGETYVCGSRRIILSSLSPHPVGDPIWVTLADVRKSFRCS